MQSSRWGFLISILLGTVSILFFGAIFAMTGLIFIIQPFVQVTYRFSKINLSLSILQMIGGFIHPGKPMASMYFVLFSYSKCYAILYSFYSPRACFIDSVNQAQLLLRDLKIAQCKIYALFSSRHCHKFQMLNFPLEPHSPHR